MSLSIVVIIREDPLKSPKPVEALRIALGLATGANPLTIILVGQAPQLFADGDCDVLDGDILEQYLPALKQLDIPLILLSGSFSATNLDPELHFREASVTEIASLTASADRVLTF